MSAMYPVLPHWPIWHQYPRGFAEFQFPWHIYIDRIARLESAPMQMDLIDTFLDLCETRSFNQSADRLGVTQSTVSGRVRSLEKSVGARLFRRSRAGTELTTAGLRFEPHARALRVIWAEARQAVQQSDAAAMTLRLGIQHDLLDNHVGPWTAAIRGLLPDAALYVEADYSVQMCRDLTSGALDLAIMFSPSRSADLYVENLGELAYRMVSTECEAVTQVQADRYILPNYAPAFTQSHAAQLPGLSGGPVSSGQAGVVRELLLSLGGTTYLPENTVNDLVSGGLAQAVPDAPVVHQPVFAAVHLRNRHRPAFRRILRGLKAQLP
jgi:DNA-binding transcriptional LysR family regulator